MHKAAVSFFVLKSLFAHEGFVKVLFAELINRLESLFVSV